MSELKSLSARLAEIRSEYAKRTNRTNQEILDTYVGYFPLWEDYLGKSLTAGMLVVDDGIKYLVMQDIDTVLESQPPNGEGMYALYRAYRDAGAQVHVPGEYAEIGYLRYSAVNGLLYNAFADPGANIYSPDLVPSVWEAESVDAGEGGELI